MKFLLLSHHTGREVPENEKEENIKAWGEWIKLLGTNTALPVHGGKTITSESSQDYSGDVGGALIFEAASFEEAVEKAKKSPGLKYGWTHDILQEMSM
ncbi:MAG TPA: hypothetical protein VLF89_01615 [Candidatus Saccharimonadales bacterium]|nr:hypothetical protein [Candidatus Saccharimonadales bacterium]